MLLQAEREELVTYGKKIFSLGLTNGTTGNLSVYNAEEKLMAITPSGMDYFETEPDDMVVMRLDGSVVEGRRKPSTEVYLHAQMYRDKPGIFSVIHTHSDYAAIMGCLRWDLPAMHYMIYKSGEAVVRCAEYATCGSEQLGRNASAAMTGDSKACFLANHGLLVTGTSLKDALSRAVQVEWLSKLYIRARSVGSPVILDEEEMARIKRQGEHYGQRKG